MSVVDPKNLGNKVKTRVTNWLDLAMRAWGSEFHAPDHGVYEFSNGRKFDSTDKGLTGLYGVDVEDVLVLSGMPYPDMRDGLFTNDGNPTLGQELPFGRYDELALDGQGILSSGSDTFNTFTPPSAPPFTLPSITAAGAFNTQVYVGDGTASRLITGIDLSAGGVVWVKNGTNSQTADLYYSADGSTIFRLSTGNGAFAWTASADATFGASGVTLTSTRNNAAANTFIIQMFQKRSRMVDVIRYTGNGETGRKISHSLFVNPGMIIVGLESGSIADAKVYSNARTPNQANYATTLQGSGATDYSAASAGARAWNNTAPDNLGFTVGYTSVSGDQTNVSGNSYFALVFADDTNSDGIIRCVGYTGTGVAPGQTITLGWQPQMLMFIQSIGGGGGLDGFVEADKNKGFGSPTTRTYYSKINSGDSGWGQPALVSSTGFQLNSVSADVNGSGQAHAVLCVRQ